MMGETAHSGAVSKMLTPWGLISSYWKSDQKYKALGLGAATTALTFGDIYLGVEMLKWAGTFINTLTTPTSDMYDLGMEALKYAGLASGFAAVWNTRYYLERLMIVDWRGWLTKEFGNAVFNDKAFAHINSLKTVPNLDQRLSEDADVLVSQIVELYTGGTRSILNLLASAYALYQMGGTKALEIMGQTIMIPTSFFWYSGGTALLAAALGTVMIRSRGKPSVALGEEYVRAQGEMRSNLTNTFSQTREIASYKDQEVERRSLINDFKQVRKTLIGYEKMRAKIGALLTINNDISKLGGWGMGATAYKMGLITSAGAVITYVGFWDKLRDSFAWPMQVSQSIFQIQTRINLMNNFAKQIELSKDPQNFYKTHGKSANIKIKKEPGEAIILNNLSLRDSVHDKPVLNVPNLRIDKGERIILTAPSGSGKSLLVRAIDEQWNFGDGEIILPSGLSRMFISQTPLVKANITLKENVAYPDAEAAEYSDEEVMTALRQAELGYLIPYLHDKNRNGTSWTELSKGEQQRLMFARLFLHKPDIIGLDEATSGLDSHLQDCMYQRLNELLPDATVISIAHRKELMRYHGRHLELKDEELIDHGALPDTSSQAFIYRPFIPPKPPLHYT